MTNQNSPSAPTNPEPDESVLDILRSGPMKLTGQFVWGSNHTFLAQVGEHPPLPAVYKPARGERPLWDFPDGSLAGREVAAYITSRALGWDLVPPTVLRPDGPAGEGSVQLYIEAESDRHYFTFTEDEKPRLRPAAAFDALINNADRKGGHVLIDAHHHIWLIDHGVCFHIEPKLRTVIWDFAGDPIPAELVEDLRRFRLRLAHDTALVREYSQLLAPEEVESLARRADNLVRRARFPSPGRERSVPWPPL
jgi:uncharacterized repeat protein (TIGR03843 family)